jgi:2-polyprenyl-3-methyl-5-hydroxy-6-metoxy-1,4-benzoquinol methylase
MAENGFEVIAVDKSKDDISQLKKTAKPRDLKIKTICDDVRNFTIEDNKYNVIGLFNIVQLLPKGDALNLIKKAKKKIKPAGFIVVCAFTNDNPSGKKIKFKFKSQELLKIFLDFKVLKYFEGIITDKPHRGFPKLHKHGVARILAQKI